jgi:hypothetical protein
MKNELENSEKENYIISSCKSPFSYPSKLNGLSCPKCHSELIDTNPNVTLTAVLPNKEVACSRKNCAYSGYREVLL